jgi:hypothetical protein
MQDKHKNEDIAIANEAANKEADEAAEEPLFGVDPVIEEHGKDNVDPEIDPPVPDDSIEDQRSNSSSNAGENK